MSKKKHKKSEDEVFRLFESPAIKKDSDITLSSIIGVLNGNIEKICKYQSKKPKQHQLIDISSKKFCKSSMLKWKDVKSDYDIKSTMFKCRFTTLVVGLLVGNLNDVAKRYNKAHKKEKMSNLECIELITNRTIQFTKIMITKNEEYKNIVLLMHELISYTKSKNEYENENNNIVFFNHNTLRNTLNHLVVDTRKMFKDKTDKKGKEYRDGLYIHNIFTIAYLLATNDTENLDVIPQYKKMKNLSVENDLKAYIKYLGRCINEQNNTDIASDMFKAFIVARPKIDTNYEVKEHTNLYTGLLALTYAKFILNDKKSDKFINKIMHKGRGKAVKVEKDKNTKNTINTRFLL